MIIRGDARNLPLADASVDLICTSPPFYALRSYTDGGEHYEGQIGAEKTPAGYIDNLIACTREWMRVLKPSGSLWLNLGDKYNSAASGQNLRDIDDRGVGHARGANAKRYDDDRRTSLVESVRPKSLLGLPWRYALRCIDELGLILRAEIIWSKPNGLPESVTDRVRRSHEQWFHLVQQPRYYAAVDRIRTPVSSYVRPVTADRGRRDGSKPRTMTDSCNPLGALPGSVWTVPTQPLKVPDHLGIDHFAAFPMEWPRRIIQGWSPEGICTGCGEGRRPVTVKGEHRMAGHGGNYAATPYDPNGRADGMRHGRGASSLRTVADHAITGEVCACPDTSAPARPSIVLDPFSGTGTTALMAHALGRVGIGVDMSADYCRLGMWRTTDPDQRAAALEVDKPPRQVAGQDDLLTLLGGAS